MSLEGLRRRAGTVLQPFGVLLTALCAGSFLCFALSCAAGVKPLDLAAALWEGAWGSPDAAATSLAKTTPLLLNGLAVALAYQVRLLNIGCEGQLTLGALAAAGFANIASFLPPFLLLPLTVLAGAAAGALWALPPLWLRQRRGVHEVISTLLLNYAAIYLAEYLVLGPLGDGTAMGRTPEIPAGAAWGTLWHFGTQGITAAPVIALAAAVLAQAWLSGTVWGYEVRATGSNPEAARAAGISVEAWQMRLFLLSGAVAGLAGALEIVAVHHRFYRAFSPGYGFDGITAAFLVNTVPAWLPLSGLLLAGLRAADKWLQMALGVSPSVILVIQAVLLLSVACREGFQAILRGKWKRAGRSRGGGPIWSR